MHRQTETTSTVTPTIAIRDNRFAQEPFDAALASSSRLCLEMSKDHFRFCLIKPAEKPGQPSQCFWLESYSFPTLLTDTPLIPSLKAIYQDHPVLQAAFWKDITVSVNTPAFTLVPSKLFRKEYAANYLQLMRGSALPLTEHIQTYVHPNEGFHSVFNLDIRLADWLSATYPLQQVKIVHQTSALLQASVALSQNSPQTVLFYFEDEYVTAIVREGKSLRFCNKFAFKNTSDLTYYLLYIITELDLEPTKVNVQLFGEITPFADTYISLKRFLPQMTFGTSLPELLLTPEFDEIPDHRYVSLYGAGLLL
ncbi:DUF3822 family protein [Tellurirhabdus bombi]|uniref:DUF3822 family protein n=1 Tax=Tellurirhabdus bombi TaxID=2907205 RepID=UPI001F445F7D|nr:DUF3822 family protein [Tellurirhabdus bombi]